MKTNPSDRKCYKIGSEHYRMDQYISMKGQDEGYDATGNYWIVGCVKVISGDVWFARGDQKIVPNSDTFILVLPKHSVVTPVLKDATTINSAVFSKNKELTGMPTEPIVFSVPNIVTFRSINDVEDILTKIKGFQPVQRAINPHPKTLKLMKYLGEHFQDKTPLPELAKKFALEASVLSRTFRRDWGKPPIHFRNYLRILDSFRHLAEECAITDIAYEVGFNDLSRFMKQFKGTVGFTPHSIKKKSKTAKFSK